MDFKIKINPAVSVRLEALRQSRNLLLKSKCHLLDQSAFFGCLQNCNKMIPACCE